MSEIWEMRAATRAGLDAALANGRAGELVDDNAAWHLSAPGMVLSGATEIEEGWLAPLRRAFDGCHRRDLFFIGGRNIREQGGDWVACVTHYVGNFHAPFFGLRPSGRLAFLRSGEFYRITDRRISEARIIFDLPDLMRQAGRFPLPRELGTEMMFPAPATQDGLVPTDRSRSAESMAVVEGMLADLHKFDPETFDSHGQTGADGYWAEDMMWYGPGGIGSNYRWSGFVKDHREKFLTAFPDRKGGNHYCRFADGDYAAISGWPSMTMTHQGPYLGIEPTGKALTLRVMDFYRCRHHATGHGHIAENWVCLDYMDLTAQMSRDLVAEANAMPPL